MGAVKTIIVVKIVLESDQLLIMLRLQELYSNQGREEVVIVAIISNMNRAKQIKVIKNWLFSLIREYEDVVGVHQLQQEEQ